MKKLKRVFYGRVRETGEPVEIDDYRKENDTTTQWNVRFRTAALGGKAYCWTRDGREVRVANGMERYVNVEKLEGKWEIEDGDGWTPIEVSANPF